MRRLRSFEDWLSRLLEDRLGDLLGRQLEPVDLERRLARHMDDNRVIGTGRRYAPNAYRLFLAPGTLSRYERARQSLEQSLARALTDHARAQGYDMLGRVTVAVRDEPALSRGAIRIEADMADLDRTGHGSAAVHTQAIRAQAPAPPAQALTIRAGGRRFRLDNIDGVSLGRALDNDIIVDDPSVSRRHASIRPRNGQWLVEDHDSRSGTFLNGRQVTAAYVRAGDRVLLGNAALDLEDAGADDSP